MLIIIKTYKCFFPDADDKNPHEKNNETGPEIDPMIVQNNN